MADKNLGTFEMLWDCGYCGTKKLLGTTHRHCPGCGAPQNPSHRYFPADNEKVAVKDHEFVGADKLCPACQTGNAAKAKNCVNCGAPLDGATAARQRQDQRVGAKDSFKAETESDAKAEAAAQKLPQHSKPLPPKAVSVSQNKNKLWMILGVTGLVVMIILLITLALAKKDVGLSVAGHAWVREIKIESFSQLVTDAWCNEMPREAYNVSRKQQKRSERDVPDGETCEKRRVDNGDGTFSEKLECQPKYRKEAVFEDRCRYTINRWSENRSVKKEGQSVTDPLAWPEVPVFPPVPADGPRLGMERMGPQRETYTVYLQDPKGERFECQFPEAAWKTYAVGSVWKGKVRMIGNTLDCGSLQK